VYLVYKKYGRWKKSRSLFLGEQLMLNEKSLAVNEPPFAVHGSYSPNRLWRLIGL
jgi:hypothetical protein